MVEKDVIVKFIREWAVSYVKHRDMIAKNIVDIKEEQDKVIKDIEKYISSAKGKVIDVERIGKKKLAYKIKKRGEGVYVNIKFEALSEGIVALNKKLKMKEDILRVFILRK